jgi:hypothetical protein
MPPLGQFNNVFESNIHLACFGEQCIDPLGENSQTLASCQG